MYAKISYGDRMSGLLTYLVGPGRTNEHTEPHLVGGDPAMMAWHDDNELDRNAGLLVAKHLDRPRRAFAVERPGGHVFHCSLALRAEEGLLTDEKWRQISEAFVERMGFGTHDGAKAPTRWVAVRHGVSAKGNDHVHLVVNLVREDGTKASVHNDRIRARDLCRELETEFGLEPLESAGRGRASVGFEYPEREAAARRLARGKHEQSRRGGGDGAPWESLPRSTRDGLVAAEVSEDQPRWLLARKVRACATASHDEGEFVRRLRQHGVLVRPRFADGRTDVVMGYSVAVKPVAGERPIWYGGGHLAKDLTLPRMRSEWPDTPQDAGQAVQEWEAAKRGRSPITPGRETSAPDAAVWDQVGAELEDLRARLREVPIEDRDTWARVARQTAGALAAWSARVEPEPGPLAASADALARSAQTTRAAKQPRVPLPSAAGAAYLLLAVTSGNGPAAYAVVLRQLANLAKALHDMHVVSGELQRAKAIEQAVRRDLATVSAGFTTTPAAVTRPQGSAPESAAREAIRLARQGQIDPNRAPGPPLPNKLPDPRPRTTPGAPRPGRDKDRGHDR